MKTAQSGLDPEGQLSMEDVPTMVLCKPKLLPLKSVTLEKLEKMQMEAQEAVKQQELALKQQSQVMMEDTESNSRSCRTIFNVFSPLDSNTITIA
ncbi:BBSome-interacting protein 1 [Liparis tanakae]|uniref:BBSome-interacting protein 1 n=1 Tax=Liparis tanakae TaxID=230148 RepID=A0A4Z2H9F1_9TELE|nr:BBSome-interacting protein 1 [Liparis tanakae]